MKTDLKVAIAFSAGLVVGTVGMGLLVLDSVGDLAQDRDVLVRKVNAYTKALVIFNLKADPETRKAVSDLLVNSEFQSMMKEF